MLCGKVMAAQIIFPSRYPTMAMAIAMRMLVTFGDGALLVGEVGCLADALVSSLSNRTLRSSNKSSYKYRVANVCCIDWFSHVLIVIVRIYFIYN